MANPLTIRTRDATLRWPRVPIPEEAPVLILVNQFQHSQQLSAEVLRRRQFVQLRTLLSHCLNSVPYYRERLTMDMSQPNKELSAEEWASIPILNREDILSHTELLEASTIPNSHGDTQSVQSAGGTGEPVTIKVSSIPNLHFQANIIRNGIWHEYDPAMRVGSIVKMNDEQLRHADEGKYSSWMAGFVSGPSYFYDVAVPPEAQIAWLRENQIQLLVTTPSNLRNLARTCLRDDLALPDLRSITTMGEPITDHTRMTVDKAFELSIQDAYVAQEVGVIALQCPHQDGGTISYHIMAEGVYVEILNGDDEPCAPGEIGKVVVTPLHNFAMPLLRYDLGDYAEVGEPCACGRGLPTLKRILGRTRNKMVMSNGQSVWMPVEDRGLQDIAPVIQQQVVQKTLATFDAHLVTERPLTEVEKGHVHTYLLNRLNLPGNTGNIHLDVLYGDVVRFNPGGKFEGFICAITPEPIKHQETDDM